MGGIPDSLPAQGQSESGTDMEMQQRGDRSSGGNRQTLNGSTASPVAASLMVCGI